MGVCSLCDNSFSDGFIVSLFFCHVRCTSTNKYNLKREREVTGFFFPPKLFTQRTEGKKRPESGSGALEAPFLVWRRWCTDEISQLLFTQPQTHNVYSCSLNVTALQGSVGSGSFHTGDSFYGPECVKVQELQSQSLKLLSFEHMLLSTGTTSSQKPFLTCQFGPDALLCSHSPNPWRTPSRRCKRLEGVTLSCLKFKSQCSPSMVRGIQ